MDPVNIFSVASQHSRWLALRQTTVAQNIANANTPGYKAVDVLPFEETLAATRLSMARTRPAHLMPAGVAGGQADKQEIESSQIVHSGNSVTLEQQLLSASEITGAFSLNTSTVKAFHRMLMTSSRG